MRVWLVEGREDDCPRPLEALLKQLAERSEGGLVFVGSGPFRPALGPKLCGLNLDLLLVDEPAWPEGPELEAVLQTGVGLVVATSPDRCQRFLLLAERYPVWLLPAAPLLDDLQLAIQGAAAARRRHALAGAQIGRLQQRLSDRIVIERAKGVLLRQLGITEEEAYQRLRVQSRRQRRPLRDIAQSLLDTQCLLAPQANGLPEGSEHAGRAGSGASLPPPSIP